jgi:hypothetical protein
MHRVNVYMSLYDLYASSEKQKTEPPAKGAPFGCLKSNLSINVWKTVFRDEHRADRTSYAL